MHASRFLSLLKRALQASTLFLILFALIPGSSQSSYRRGQLVTVISHVVYGSLCLLLDLSASHSLGNQCGLKGAKLLFRRLQLGQGRDEARIGLLIHKAVTHGLHVVYTVASESTSVRRSDMVWLAFTHLVAFHWL